MAQYDELVSVLRDLLTNRFSPLPRYVNALLGDGQGNVVPPDRPDMSYARFTKESTNYFEVFNVTVPKVHNWPVKIGEIPWNPGLTQVVGTNWSAFEQSGWGDVLGDTSPHGPTHEYPDGSPGADVVNIYTRAIVPGRAFLTNAAPATIYVNALEYGTTGTLWGGLPGVNLQPLMSSMVTGTMRYAGVYLDSTTNTLGIVTGATTVFTSAFDPPRVSFPATGAIPIARVRVYGGQASLAEVDVKDARRLFGQGGGAGAYAGGSYITRDTETLDLPNSSALLDGIGTAVDNSTPGETHVNLDISSLTESTTPDDSDLIPIYDNSAAGHAYQTRATLLTGSVRILVKNTSGGVVAAGDVGYIDSAGEFKTTTTAALAASWAVVLVGGANNADIYVTNRGRVSAAYTGTAPNAGDYLVTSTSAGDAQQQTTMRPEIFAVCVAGGSGGLVSALLLCGTTNVPVSNSEFLYACATHSSSDFIATINGAPTATSVVYNAPSTGSDDVIEPTASTHLAKLLLYNSTRSTYRLITAVNIGTKTITTVSSADAWASGDTITIRAQTIGATNGYAILDLSQQTAIPVLARYIMFSVLILDSGGGAAGVGRFFAAHPDEAFASSKQSGVVYIQSTSNVSDVLPIVPLINRRFGIKSIASSTATMSTFIFVSGYGVATP